MRNAARRLRTESNAIDAAPLFEEVRPTSQFSQVHEPPSDELRDGSRQERGKRF
jgi:hypothetical protein